MTEIVDSQEIERIVGMPRHLSVHYARAVPAQRRIFILHSEECLSEYTDLRQCEFSRALAHPGPRMDAFRRLLRGPTEVEIDINGYLIGAGDR